MTEPITKRGFAVGGPTAWKVTVQGDIACAFHWIGGEPSMVLYPLHRELRLNRAIPYALTLPSAHELVLEGTKGESLNSAVLIQKAAKACHVLGLGSDWSQVKGMADAIMRNLDQLVKMPPEPDWHARREAPEQLGGTVQLNADGVKVGEMEV